MQTLCFSPAYSLTRALIARQDLLTEGVMNMSESVAERLNRRDDLMKRLRAVFRVNQLIERAEDIAAYEYDAVSAYRQRPLAVAFSEQTSEVAAVIKVCAEPDIPIVPWGAVTGLSGGALVRQDGVVLSTARMSSIE